MIDLAEAADLDAGDMDVGLNHISLQREGKKGDQGGDEPHPGEPQMSIPAAHMNSRSRGPYYAQGRGTDQSRKPDPR